MYSKQQKETALKLFKETQSVSETVRILGYPTRKNLYNWIYEEKNPPSKRKEYPIVENSSRHPRNPSLKVKLDAIHRCFELGENIKYVSEDIGYSRASIYHCSTNPAEIIPVGMATMPTPRKAMKMLNTLPRVVMG